MTLNYQKSLVEYVGQANALKLFLCGFVLNISILVVLLYAWRISVNIKKYSDLEDVYYGVQIAYFAIIATQLSMIFLSIVLLIGIHKENVGFVVPWIIGFVTFMALEAVAMVYSNVLRDHVNRWIKICFVNYFATAVEAPADLYRDARGQFDSLCKAEVAFFIARAFINSIAMWGVLRFYNLLRIGVSWKGPEVIEL